MTSVYEANDYDLITPGGAGRRNNGEMALVLKNTGPSRISAALRDAMENPVYLRVLLSKDRTALVLCPEDTNSEFTYSVSDNGQVSLAKVARLLDIEEQRLTDITFDDEGNAIITIPDR